MKKILALVLCLIATASQALKIEITKGEVRPDPIAITAFHSDDSDAMSIGQDIAEVVGNDLQSSGLFELISKTAFIQQQDSIVKDGPRFADWRVLNARFLVTGNIKSAWGGSLTVEFRLFDVITGQQMIGLAVEGDKSKWRRIAHKIADAIYSRVTNETGLFDTQVIYVEAVTPKGRTQRKRLMRMDQDGEGVEPLTDGHNFVLTPRYSPDGKRIAYLAYANKSAHVYLMDLGTKTQKLLDSYGDMSYAPRFSPDSKTVVMGLIKQGKSAIYSMDLASKKLVRLTDHISIDTSPCFSADGQQIAFTSDRGGKEQIYIMDKNGQNVRRISFGGGKYSQPVWSPRGDLIAFTKQIGNQFFIGVMAPDGSGERLITEGFLVEGADWSPNGRYLIFSKEHAANSKSQIYMVDLTGRNIRAIKTPKDASDCTWSPLLK